MKQKFQWKKLKAVDPQSPTWKKDYVEQRARGAYIASICQPEASCALSIAAQHKDPTPEQIADLNKITKWQQDNHDRGLKYIAVPLEKAALYVFVDGSFANLPDLSSQIGFEVFIGTEEITENSHFRMRGNLIHSNSIKCHRVTRAVLASELYGMVNGVDIALTVNSTISKILVQLGLSPLPIIVCTDSYSLYQCLVKLGTTQEKRLIIDIMALRESYERRELQEIRWINGEDNPADAMTKINCNDALKRFLDTNQLDVRVEGWVKRDEVDA